MQHWRKFQAALIFYTCLPLRPKGMLDFRGIALYAPLIGILIGIAIASLATTDAFMMAITAKQ